MINIPSYITDPNYRYRMPKVVAKIEGRGNGIKTNVANMAEVAAALKCQPAYPVKFFGSELGAQSSFTEKDQKAIVNGAHEARVLQQLIDQFIERFVLCQACKLPEMILYLKGKKNGTVNGKCSACGWDGLIDNSHKLCSFILKNHTTTEAPEEEKKKKKDSKPKKRDDDDDPKKEKKKEKEKKERNKTPKEESGEDEKKKKKSSRNREDTGKRELLDMNAENALDGVIADMTTFSESPECCSPHDFCEELRNHQYGLGLSSQAALLVAVEVLMKGDASAKTVIAKYKYIKKVVDLKTVPALQAIECYVFKKCTNDDPSKEKGLQQLIGKLIEDHRLKERDVLEYYNGKKPYTDEYLDKSTEAQEYHAKGLKATKKLIDWLKSSGNSSESSEDEDDEEVKHLAAMTIASTNDTVNGEILAEVKSPDSDGSSEKPVTECGSSPMNNNGATKVDLDKGKAEKKEEYESDVDIDDL
eukprot:Filipodium_phascolosomae@DN2325_c0_g1_i1.p1